MKREERKNQIISKNNYNKDFLKNFQNYLKSQKCFQNCRKFKAQAKKEASKQRRKFQGDKFHKKHS